MASQGAQLQNYNNEIVKCKLKSAKYSRRGALSENAVVGGLAVEPGSPSSRAARPTRFSRSSSLSLRAASPEAPAADCLRNSARETDQLTPFPPSLLPRYRGSSREEGRNQ